MTSFHPDLAENLPTLDELQQRAHVAHLPMRTTFRGIDYREVMVFDAPQGFSEFSPFLEYDATESVPWLASAVEAGWVGMPDARRDIIPVNATLPALDAHKDAERIEELLGLYPGCDTVKIKVAEPGQTLVDDIDRVNLVRSLMPDAKLRVDANGAWGVDEALEAAQALVATGPIEYMEQPCSSVEELADVRRKIMGRGLFVRIAADESIRKVEDPYAVANNYACDVAVLKVAPLGGARNVLEIGDFMHQKLLGITISSALESSIGIGTALQTASALPSHEDESGLDAPMHAAGLATGVLFIEDLTEPRRIENGHLSVTPLAADPERLHELKVSGDRLDWHQNRLAQTYNNLKALL